MISKMIDANIISVLKEGNYLSFILSNDGLFSQIGYKVMRNLDGDLFIRSVKVRHNGKTKLIYDTESFHPLTEIACRISEAELWNVLFRVADGVIQIRNNGFLSCENLLLDFDNIYFDTGAMKAHFIYLPVMSGNIENTDQSVERLFNSQMKKLFESIQQITENERSCFINTFCNSVLTFEEIRRTAYFHVDEKNIKNDCQQSKEMNGLYLVGLDLKEPVSFWVTGERFTIGRRKDNDGVLDFSKQISRLHCSIICKNGKYGIVDENSKYGTEVNHTKCIPGKFYEIHEGDMIKLPMICFKVQQ